MLDTAKKRLLALKSYQALSPDARAMVKGHLLMGINFEDLAFVFELRNPQRTWESPKVQKVLADFRRDGTNPDTDWQAALEAINPEFDALNTVQNASGCPRSDPQDNPIPQQVQTTPATCEECGQSAGSTYGARLLCPACFSRALGFKPKFSDEPPTVPDAESPHKPVKTTRPCQVCNDRLAWFDGVTCGPCAGSTAKAPTPEVILGSEGYGLVDSADLFPGLTGENAQLWRDQRDREQDERHRLTALLASREEPRF